MVVFSLLAIVVIAAMATASWYALYIFLLVYVGRVLVSMAADGGV
jgi:hypothetical protein